jgi:hypothetical protein
LLEDDKEQETHSGLGLRKIVRELTRLSLKDTETTTTTTTTSLSSPNSSDTTSHDHNHTDNRLQKTRIVSTTNKEKEKMNVTAFEKRQPQSSQITIDYPCSVHNRFECPYHNRSSEINDLALLDAGTALHIIYNALSYAHMLTYQTRDYTYKVDFETGSKVETISKYGGWRLRYNKRFGVELTNLKQPKVPIESIHDIYKALTDTAILDVLLEEYLEHRRKNPKDYGDSPTSDYTKRKEQGDTVRCSVIEWFTEIKDDIKIEDLTNFNGISLL